MSTDDVELVLLGATADPTEAEIVARIEHVVTDLIGGDAGDPGGPEFPS